MLSKMLFVGLDTGVVGIGAGRDESPSRYGRVSDL